MKKIAVFTGTRAEYGLLYWIIKALDTSEEVELQLLVGGAHLSHEFGYTVDNIVKDGFTIAERLEFLLASDSAQATSKSLALAIISASDCLSRIKPDLVVLLGDRYESLAIAQSAMLANIPIAHIHGGEITEGAVDDVIRHAISKMSHLHFTSTESYRKRVIQLGEQPERVFNVGAPGLDNIHNLSLLGKEALAESLKIPELNSFFLVTYHPETLSLSEAESALNNLLVVLAKYETYKVLITFPNADTDGRKLIKVLEAFEKKYPDRVKLFESMGQLKYLSAMKYASAVVGNSSSGIIEAPSFHIPTVNIGDRQKGRIASTSVIHCDETIEGISAAIEDAISMNLCNAINPYGMGGASEKIVKKLLSVSYDQLLLKQFYDVDFK